MKARYEKAAIPLKATRKLQGLTQMELASMLKIHVQHVSNAERGLCLIPTKKMRKLYKLMTTENKILFEKNVTDDMSANYLRKIRK